MICSILTEGKADSPHVQGQSRKRFVIIPAMDTTISLLKTDNMKKHFTLLITFLFLGFIHLPQYSHGQAKDVISTHRVFPKMDKILAFEKGLAAHARKYHTGDVRWNVFEIVSGPDGGGYHITEGPKTWESEDKRGNLGEAHTHDWHKKVAAYLTERQSLGYYVYIDSLSTVAVDDFSEKINITHIFPKPGQGENVVKIIRKVKNGWAASGITVAVYASNSSGPTQYVIVTRYKQGLKEKTPGFRKPFKEVYDSVNGAGAFAQYINDISAYVESSWSELLILRKDLSSH